MEEGEVSVDAAAKGAKGVEELAQGRGRAVLSSSTGEQRSWIRQDRQMSIFTYHLIEALTGHAEPEEGAREVLVSDVMGHVYRHVPKSVAADWGAEQTPDYQLSGNFPVALLLGGEGLSKGLSAPDPLEMSVVEAVPSYQATVIGDGAIAQGAGAVAAGAGGVAVGRDVDGDVHIDQGDEIHGDVAGRDIDKRTIHTGGGAYIDGDVDLGGGDFVGRDKVMGDKVGGDKIDVGGISGSTGFAIGRGAQAHVNQLFEVVYQQIEARSEDPDVDKEELADTVQKIEKEAAKGEQANANKVGRWLGFLADMAPDILKVTAATLANPAAGVATAVRLIAEKFRAEAGSA
jgi:hypothetical protein